MLSQCGVRGFHGNDIASNLARVPGAKQLGGSRQSQGPFRTTLKIISGLRRLAARHTLAHGVRAQRYRVVSPFLLRRYTIESNFRIMVRFHLISATLLPSRGRGGRAFNEKIFVSLDHDNHGNHEALLLPPILRKSRFRSKRNVSL